MRASAIEVRELARIRRPQDSRISISLSVPFGVSSYSRLEYDV
jgi:hypothetical protein